MARGTQRVTAGETPGGEPDALRDAVTIDGLYRVFRARREEPALASKELRKSELLASTQRQAPAPASATGRSLSGVVVTRLFTPHPHRLPG